MLIFEFVRILAMIVACIMPGWIIGSMLCVLNANGAKSADNCGALFPDKEDATLRIDQEFDVERSASAVSSRREAAAEIITTSKNTNASSPSHWWCLTSRSPSSW